MAGGTRLSATRMAAVPIVTVTPTATAAATTSDIVANQTWINLDRVISLTTEFTCFNASESYS